MNITINRYQVSFYIDTGEVDRYCKICNCYSMCIKIFLQYNQHSNTNIIKNLVDTMFIYCTFYYFSRK